MPSLTAPILELVVNEQLKDWLFDGRKSIVVVDINDAFRELIQDRAWLVMKVSYTCHIPNVIQWWCRIIESHSFLPFGAKVFLWWAMVGRLCLAMSLKHWPFPMGYVSLCIVIEEDAHAQIFLLDVFIVVVVRIPSLGYYCPL